MKKNSADFDLKQFVKLYKQIQYELAQEKIVVLCHEYNDSVHHGYSALMLYFGHGIESDTNAAKALADRHFRSLSKRKCSESHYIVGCMYAYGIGINMNGGTAKKYLLKAAAKDHSLALLKLGQIELKGKKKNYKQAFDYLKRAYKHGSIEASYLLGTLYLHGNGPKQDKNTAFDLFKEAVDCDHLEAIVEHGNLYSDPKTKYFDLRKAFEHFEKAAKRNHSEAIDNVGYMCQHGQGTETSIDLALEWYKKGADLGYAESLYNYGYLHAENKKVKQDLPLAIKYYHLAADKGHKEANFNLGFLYSEDKRMEHDQEKAFGHFLYAAKKGITEAAYRVGMMYKNAIGTEENTKEAFKWLEKVAKKKNDPSAIENLVEIIITDDSIVIDKYERLKWLRQVADQGNKNAIIALSVCDECPQFERVRWLQQAAENGDAKSMRTLGAQLLKNKNIVKDSSEGKKWLLKAADNGDAAAQNVVGNFYEVGVLETDFVKATHYYSLSAAQDFPLAYYNLSMMYLRGLGTKKDNQRACDLLLSSAQKDNSEALKLIAILFDSYEENTDNNESALEWFKQTVEKAEPETINVLSQLVEENIISVKDIHLMQTEEDGKIRLIAEEMKELLTDGDGKVRSVDEIFTLIQNPDNTFDPKSIAGAGICFENGWLNFVKNINHAITCYKVASDKDHDEATARLASIYHTGDGVWKNIPLARQYYQRLADKGIAKYVSALGSLYLLNPGKDLNRALTLLHDAADKGATTAKCQLGIIYHNPIFDIVDFKKAFYWFEQAAHENDVTSMCFLGTLYIRGDGVAQSYRESRNWYKKAAESGDKSAMTEYGNMLSNKKYGSPNIAEARKWLVKSANLGHPKGMNSLGVLYASSIAGKQNYYKAKMWFTKAANEGYKEACKNLEKLRTSKGTGNGKMAVEFKQ